MFSGYYLKSSRINCIDGEINTSEKTSETGSHSSSKDDIFLLDYINSDLSSDIGFSFTESSYNVSAGSSNIFSPGVTDDPQSSFSYNQKSMKNQNDSSSFDKQNTSAKVDDLQEVKVNTKESSKDDILWQNLGNDDDQNCKKHHTISQICHKIAGKMKFLRNGDGHDKNETVNSSNSPERDSNIEISKSQGTRKNHLTESRTKGIFRLLSDKVVDSDLVKTLEINQRYFSKSKVELQDTEYFEKEINQNKSFDKTQQNLFAKFQQNTHANTRASIFDLFHYEMKVRPDTDLTIDSTGNRRDKSSSESFSSGLISYYTDDNDIWNFGNSTGESNANEFQGGIFSESPDILINEPRISEDSQLPSAFEAITAHHGVDTDEIIIHDHSIGSSVFSFEQTESSVGYRHRYEDSRPIKRENCEDGLNYYNNDEDSMLSHFFGIFRSNTDGHIQKASNLKSMIKGMNKESRRRSSTLRYFEEKRGKLDHTKEDRRSRYRQESEIKRTVRERFENGSVSPLPDMVLKYSRSMRNMVYNSKISHSATAKEIQETSSNPKLNKTVRSRVEDIATMLFGSTK